MEHFTAIGYNLRPFGTVCGHLVYFSRFGMIGPKKNLAILVSGSFFYFLFSLWTRGMPHANKSGGCYKTSLENGGTSYVLEKIHICKASMHSAWFLPRPIARILSAKFDCFKLRLSTNVLLYVEIIAETITLPMYFLKEDTTQALLQTGKK
jgi:hypothetical protein